MKQEENNSGLVNNEMSELSTHLYNLNQVLLINFPYMYLNYGWNNLTRVKYNTKFCYCEQVDVLHQKINDKNLF